jgi:nicotinate phosphoribosyltransferase
MREPQSMFPEDRALGLMTDFYELTMAAGYWSVDHNPRATFEVFARSQPLNRQYLLVAGLEQAVHYLRHLRFSGEDIDWLRGLPAFGRVRPGFWEYLAGFKFNGDAWAVPEGTVLFAGEPMMRVTGAMAECQLLETYLLTTLNAQTLFASKAARICWSAAGRSVVEFGARRAHGPQAGLLAARATYIGGCSGTSNVLAAKLLGIPAVGTQAHSWVMSFASEVEAFEKFAEVFPDHNVSLIDTYDTIEGVKNAIKAGRKMQGVRLDSGNLYDLSVAVRRILDEAGMAEVKIVASSDLNEFTIRDLLGRGAPLDMFGVGTDMVTSKDAPAISIVYKIVEVADEAGKVKPVRKFSSEKATLGGAKQIFRRFGEDGRMAGDTLGLAGERLAGEPLMVPVIEKGNLITELPAIRAIRARAENQLSKLPEHLHELRGNGYYPVSVSDKLQEYQKLAER